MSVEHHDSIDSVEVEQVTGKVVLIIEDPLDWQDVPTHLAALQGKLVLYLALIQSGELMRLYPDAQGRAVVISVVATVPPHPSAEALLQQLREHLRDSAAEFGTPVELRARVLVRG